MTNRTAATRSVVIDRETVHRLAGVGCLVEPLRQAFASDAHSPPRAHYDLEAQDQPRTLLLMPAWQPAGDIGIKIATVFASGQSVELKVLNISAQAFDCCPGLSGQLSRAA